MYLGFPDDAFFQQPVQRKRNLHHVSVVLLALAKGSCVITENIFGRPGIGQVLVTAVDTRDMPTASGVVLVVATVYVVANLLVDLAYGAIDPRLRRAT